jgi:hypothetical protein
MRILWIWFFEKCCRIPPPSVYFIICAFVHLFISFVRSHHHLYLHTFVSYFVYLFICSFVPGVAWLWSAGRKGGVCKDPKVVWNINTNTLRKKIAFLLVNIVRKCVNVNNNTRFFISIFLLRSYWVHNQFEKEWKYWVSVMLDDCE